MAASFGPMVYLSPMGKRYHFGPVKFAYQFHIAEESSIASVSESLDRQEGSGYLIK